MRKKRVMVIGPSNSGKTTLVNELNDYRGPLRKSQDVIYGKNTIDVPGLYLENTWMYKHISIIAQDASHVLILVDQSKCQNVYPPRFAKIFRCPVLGVITKIDLKPENEEKCIRQLREIGVDEPYYKICVPKGVGIDDLKKDLFLKEK